MVKQKKESQYHETLDSSVNHQTTKAQAWSTLSWGKKKKKKSNQMLKIETGGTSNIFLYFPAELNEASWIVLLQKQKL